jgi:CBS domain containing-hemolysin-like protein
MLVSKYGEMIALAIGSCVFTSSFPMRRWFFLSRRGLGIEESMLTDEKNLSDLPMSLDSEGEPLDEHEVRMIRGVVRLDKTIAREIMVPRVDMVAVELGANIEIIVDEMVSRGHSRIPVYEGSLDQVRGIAYSRDILAHLSNDGLIDVGITTDVIRPALFIPETKNLEELLSEFQESRVHMAMVVDEYGGVSGLVTIEDLLEEIVGEIQDEFDVEDPEIVNLDTNEFLMDAVVSIDQLFDLTGVNLEGDGYDTIGGFLYERLGKIPKVGDSVGQDTLSIEVVSASGRRLKKLRVTKSISQ